MTIFFCMVTGILITIWCWVVLAPGHFGGFLGRIARGYNKERNKL